jgi:hypothetical protein
VRRIVVPGGLLAVAAAAPASADQLVFDRNGGIWVMSATGGFGSERLVVGRGRTVTWGGGTVPRAVTGLRIAKRQTGDRVRGRLKIARKGTRITVELRAGGKRAGKLTRRGLRKGAFRFAVKVTRPAKTLTARVTVTPPGAGPDRASRRVRLSR